MGDFAIVVGLLLAALTVAVGIVGVVVARGTYDTWRRERSEARFLLIRTLLKSERVPLSRSALALYRSAPEVPDVSLLFTAGWLPTAPAQLDAVKVVLANNQPQPSVPRLRSGLWPISKAGRRYDTYSDAVAELDRPELFVNGISYRLLGVEADAAQWTLRVGNGRYFDYLDTGEALGYEFATLRDGPGNAPKLSSLPARMGIGGPFDLHRRSATPGVNTLTIRNGFDGATFFMHRRDSKKVAAAMGVYHVVPAGEFQPAGINPGDFGADMDLWRNMVREYAEEFLGLPDSIGSTGRTIDFDKDEPYASISRARASGDATPFFLGIGIDPLTLKPEILTVCVFSDMAFDRIFGDMPEKNTEGRLVSGHRNLGVPFTQEGVDTYLKTASVETLPAGAGCLALAWRWRGALRLVQRD